MRHGWRKPATALALGTAGVLMAAGPVYAAQSPDTGAGAPQLPGGVPSGVPGEVPDELSGKVPVELPGSGSDSGSDSGSGSGEEAGAGEAADSGGTSAGGSDTGGSGDASGSADASAAGSSQKGKEVKVPYKCKTPIGDKTATSGVTIDADASGGSYKLTVKFSAAVMDSPAEIPKGELKPSMDVKVAGDDKGTVKVEGPGNPEPIKQGSPVKVPDMSGTYKPGAEGKASLAPGVLTIKAMGTTTTCTPSEEPEPSVEVDTTDEGGVSGGGSSGGGDAGGSGGGDDTGGAAGGSGGGDAAAGGSSGGLADTGASGHGSLEALGLVAGTVILLGGAVFTFTPWRRLRATR